MATHRIHVDAPDLAPGPLIVEGEEAHHAIRVKRVGPGQTVEILNGRGRIATAVVRETTKARDSWRLAVQVEQVRDAALATPRLEVCTAAPKGARLSELIDGLSQAGAASWSLLETERGVAESAASRIDRLNRIAAEASKQCGRAWHLEIGNPRPVALAILPLSGLQCVVADESGEAYTRSGAAAIRLLIGPEGGWSPSELQSAHDSGATVASFGPHTMRIETAAVVAAAIVLDRERRE